MPGNAGAAGARRAAAALSERGDLRHRGGARRAGARRALGPEQEQHPLFRGTLTPDVTFFGFDLDAADGVAAPTADPDERLVLRLRAAAVGAALRVRAGRRPKRPSVSDWNDLSWSNFAADPTTLVNAPVTAPTGLEAGLTWPTHSAGIASATMRRPVRVGIHASVMLPADA